MILDGYGLRADDKGNAVAEGKTPVMDKLMAECPFVKGNASGMAVGLPEGQMGNSEVGHLNMGAGRIVYQDLTKITKSIQDGDFFENKALLAACENVKKNDSALPEVRLPFRLHFLLRMGILPSACPLLEFFLLLQHYPYHREKIMWQNWKLR